MLHLDYVKVGIRQGISKYKIIETGSTMKILLLLLPINNWFSCITESKSSIVSCTMQCNYATFLNKQRKLYWTPIEYIASRKIIPLYILPKPTATCRAKETLQLNIDRKFATKIISAIKCENPDHKTSVYQMIRDNLDINF